MKNEEQIEMDEKATSAIHLNLGDEIIHNILEAKIAKKISEKLEGYEKQVAYKGGFKSV